jgi:hypothetical protein
MGYMDSSSSPMMNEQSQYYDYMDSWSSPTMNEQSQYYTVTSGPRGSLTPAAESVAPARLAPEVDPGDLLQASTEFGLRRFYRAFDHRAGPPI